MSVIGKFAREVVRDRWLPATRERWLVACHRLTGPRPPHGFRLVLGKSMPRSGHHYLINLLFAYFDRSFRYCESYKVPDCCRCTPCLRAYDRSQDNSCFLQKSHDFRFTDNPRLDALYLIQCRSLIPRIQSHFDLLVRDGYTPNTREAFESLCHQEVEYSISFFEKWLKDQQPNFLVVSYESLAEMPAVTLAEVVRYISGIEADEARIAAANVAVNFKTNPAIVGIRNPRDHPFFDEDLYRKLETRVLERCGPTAMPFHFIRPE